MFARLVVLFIAVPLVELYLLFRINDLTGSAITTISLILFTGFLGAWLAKQQGISTLTRIQRALGEGRMPAQELVDGGMILFAGALLLTPGVLTDAFGFSLLMPPCRSFYRKILKQYLPKPNIQFHTPGQSSSSDDSSDPNVVEGSAQPRNDAE